MKLPKIAKMGSGGTPSRKKNEYYKNGTIPWLKSGELNNGVVTSAEEYITEKAIQESSAKIAPKGSLLVAMYGATAGKVGLLDFDSSMNQAICFIIPDTELADVKYLFYYLMSKNQELLDKREGGGQPNISQTILKSLKIPLPSLSEQKAIVAKLDRAQRLIDIDREMLNKFDELIQSVFLEMFGDPVTNPKGWEKRAIKHLLTTEKTKREDPKQTKKTYDYISISDVDNEIKKIVSHTAINKTNAPSRARQLIETNDILVSTVRPNLNSVALYNDELINPIASTGFCVLRPDLEIVNPYYLFQISQSRYFVSKLSLIANGANYPAVSGQDVLNLKIPLPLLNEQNKFEVIIEKVSQESQLTQSSYKKSRDLFSSLLQELFG